MGDSPNRSSSRMMSERIPPIGAEDSSDDDRASSGGGGALPDDDETGWGNWNEDDNLASPPAEQESSPVLTKPMTSWTANHQSLDIDLTKLDIKATKATSKPANPAMEDDLLADLEPTITKGRNLLELLEERVEGKMVQSDSWKNTGKVVGTTKKLDDSAGMDVGSLSQDNGATDFTKFAVDGGGSEDETADGGWGVDGYGGGWNSGWNGESEQDLVLQNFKND